MKAMIKKSDICEVNVSALMSFRNQNVGGNIKK